MYDSLGRGHSAVYASTGIARRFATGYLQRIGPLCGSSRPGRRRPAISREFLTAIAASFALALPVPALAEPATVCTTIELCYCINSDNRAAIEANVARIRAQIAEQRQQNKAIGYMSIPLTTVGGGYYGVNAEVAQLTKDSLERRLGKNSFWILDPAPHDNLPAGASGADYMLMWTTVLQGPRGLGEDFDLAYFVGPSDYRRFFAFDDNDDMAKIDAYFDRRLAQDETLRKAVADGKLSKREFRDYYALRASAAFSSGAHDEWDIVRILNERRRQAKDFGIARQIAILFDGRPVPPASFESSVAGGYVGRCNN